MIAKKKKNKKQVIPESASEEFRLRETNETRNNFIEKIKQNDLTSKKQKKKKKKKGFYGFTVNFKMAYFSLCYHWMRFKFWFTLLACIPRSIASSAVGSKICAITA